MAQINLIAEPGKQEVVITRLFDTPRELLYRVMTDPNTIPEWWGPKNITTTVDQMDVKKGGVWRYIQRDAKGNEFAFNGIYHEVSPNERVTNTFEFEGMMGHILLETTSFEDQDGKTLVTTRSVFQSLEDRDGMVATGMEWGTRQSTERLEALLSKIGAAQ